MLSATLLLGAAGMAAVLVLLRQFRRIGGWWAMLAGAHTESDLAGLFVFVPAGRLLWMTACGAILGMGLTLLSPLPLPAVPLVGILCMALPRLAVHWLRGRWRRRLAQQLPDALALWSGLMRAGQSTQQALGHVAHRQAAPLGDELRMVLGQLRLGLPLETAMAALRDRAGLADLRLLSTLLGTQRELGGNLAESLERLAELLRGRLVMEARIQSLTAQGRMQGAVVGILPVLLLVVLYFMERDAMRVLHTTWQGWTALAAMLVLELTGFLMIRRIVRIEV